MKARDYVILLTVILLFLGYAGTLLWAVWPIQEVSVAKSGVFGDSFGALNSLFSGLAFGGLLIAVFYQREDLGLTKTELELTRKDINAQHLETTFFHMLRLQNDIVTGIDLQRQTGEGGQQETRGRDCFKVFSKRILWAYEEHKKKKPLEDELALALAAYNQLWEKSQSDLGHYYRNLYHILRYLSEHDFEDKKQYGRIARAQLSDFELVVLFYNCLSHRGKDFVKYAEEFALFDNLDVSLLANDQHVSLLPEGVYGENEEALTNRSTGPAQKAAQAG